MDFDELGHTTDTQNSHRWRQFIDLRNLMLPCQHGMLCRYSARCLYFFGICTISGITLLASRYTSFWSREFTGWMGGVCPFRPKVKSRLMLRLRVHCGSCPILQHYTVLHNQAQLYTGQHKCTLLVLFYYQLVW